ncbi:kinase [Steroidobacter cummioxidans]|uniref:kinase n=1 Tax=Steroidobacter cummioxidans TaxID=1803913 RepID=UPI00137A3E9E
MIQHAIQARLPPRSRHPLVVGVCGSQGSGKSTVCKTLTARFTEAGLKVANLSLDDLYLPLAERVTLARHVHPLLRTRGVPGTHDTKLGVHTLNALAHGGQVPLPRFDKSIDDRRPKAQWDSIEGPAQLVFFEGWCVGARPQTLGPLDQPVNQLEANEDVDGRWRRYVNDALGGEYQRLFGKIDLLVLLAAPSFDVVLKWRTQQENELRAQSGNKSGVMDDAALVRFIQHYERLTRHILIEMPGRADLVIRLSPERTVLGRHSNHAENPL